MVRTLRDVDGRVPYAGEAVEPTYKLWPTPEIFSFFSSIFFVFQKKTCIFATESLTKEGICAIPPTVETVGFLATLS